MTRRHDPAPEPVVPAIFRWDLDKTYLKTEFDKLRHLVRIPFERAEDKINLPGVVSLMRGLKQSARAVGREVRIYFISASPRQIGGAIRDKLRLDDIEYDDIIFKDQLHNIVRGKFRNLREQIGYKLSELLTSRKLMDPQSREVLFGDDWESDPIIYSIYADVLSGQLPAADLRELLQSVHVDPMLVTKALEQYPDAAADVVQRIYINLERRIPLANFQVFGARLVPAFNYLQTAACLYQDGYLQIDAVATVAQSLIDASGYNGERITNSLADIERRGHLSSVAAATIREYFAAHGLAGSLPAIAAPRQPWWQRLRRLNRAFLLKARARLRWSLRRAAPEPPPPLAAPNPQIDYRALVAEWRALREGVRA